MKNQYQKTMVTIMTRNNRIMPSAVLLMAIILFLSFTLPCTGAEPRKSSPTTAVTPVPSSSAPTSQTLKPINKKMEVVTTAIPSIKFTKISVNFLTTNVVVAYEPPPSSMRLVCEFSSSIPNSAHSVNFYINNNEVIDKDKDFDHANFKGTTALMDIPIPAEGTYTFKCVVDSMSISLPFSVAKFRYETCHPTVKVSLFPSRSKLQNDLNTSGSSTYVNEVDFPNFPNPPDQTFNLTGSAIVSNGNEVTCNYGSAVTYKSECKNAKKVMNQHKYECTP